MSDIPAPAARPKFSPTTRIIIIIVSIAVMVGGILQMVRGLRGAKMDPEVERLLSESDAALTEGNRSTTEASPIFNAALNAVDSEGLAAVRAQKAQGLQKAGELFGKAAEQIGLAARKLDEAAAHKGAGTLKLMLETKAQSYEHYALSKTINQEICRTVLDESLKTIDEVLPKIQEAAKRRDEIEAKGNEASAEAKKIADDLRK